MFKGLSESVQTFRRSPVKIYSAGSNDRYFSPYRLGKVDPDEGIGPLKRRIDECFEFILDSGVGVEEVTNQMIIEWGEELDPSPEYIVPKDYVHQPERTTESVEEFLDLYEESSLTSEVIIPLQPTDENAADHADHYEEWEGWRTYALGGIKDADTDVQLRSVRVFRDAAGYPPRGPRVHMFGMGGNRDFIRAVRNDSRLIQSADISTMDRNLANGLLPDKFWHNTRSQDEYKVAQGDNTTTVHGWFIGGSLCHLSYMLGPDMDDEEVDALLNPKDGREQTGMSEWGNSTHPTPTSSE